MVAVLAKTPRVVAPWPPSGMEPKQVLPGEDFGAFCKRHNLPFKQLMLSNFGINIEADRDWEFYCNWYLWNKVGCRSLTPKGNCKFVGGETLYIPKVAKYEPKIQPAPRNRVELVQWFRQDILPQRTIGPGNLSNTDFWKVRGRKVVDRLVRRLGPDPNGICGAVADFVYEEYQNFGGGGVSVGFILWSQPPFFTHVANVMMPVSHVVAFEGADHAQVPVPGAPRAMSFREIAHCTVLDLYFMKVTTVELWWQEVSYLGWGTLTLDPNGEYINS